MKNQKNNSNQSDRNSSAGNFRENAVSANDGGGTGGAKPDAAQASHTKERAAAALGGTETEPESSTAAFGASAIGQTAARLNSEQLIPQALPVDLSIEKANALIAGGEEFKQLIALSISAAQDGNQISYSGLAKIRSETAEAAIRRGTAMFYRKYPLIRLFVYLGLMRANISVIEYPETLVPSITTWHFKEVCALTRRGEEQWRKLGGEIDTLTIPIAKRKFLAVTGAAPENEEMISAKITWRLLPNEIKMFLDVNSEAFLALPAELRGQLTESGIAAEISASYAKTYGGIADFVRGDSGWQLLDTYLEPLNYCETQI